MRRISFICGSLVCQGFAFAPAKYGKLLLRTRSYGSQDTHFKTEEELAGCDVVAPNPKGKPDILTPFLPAADPLWICRGPVGAEDFLVSRDGGPTESELANENILRIVRIECNDLEVNTLVWKCLGYRFDSDKEEWTAADCFPKWREIHPTPPDFVGMRRM